MYFVSEIVMATWRSTAHFGHALLAGDFSRPSTETRGLALVRWAVENLNFQYDGRSKEDPVYGQP